MIATTPPLSPAQRRLLGELAGIRRSRALVCQVIPNSWSVREFGGDLWLPAHHLPARALLELGLVEACFAEYRSAEGHWLESVRAASPAMSPTAIWYQLSAKGREALLSGGSGSG